MDHESSFIARWRTKLSQALGIAVALVMAVSKKTLIDDAPFVAGCMFALGCFLVGTAVVGRVWCGQYIAGYKARTLVRSGPYSMCRNPLYFFSLLGGIGVALCSKSITITLVVMLGFALIYPFTIASEEKKLRKIFGSEFDQYVAAVPKFLPRPSLFSEPAEYVIAPRSFRREAWDAAWFVWIPGLFVAAEAMIQQGILPIFIALP
jgi:protein-S-isoprenylcysteine O-methyltransferase Ste14